MRDVADLPAIDLLGRRARQQDQEALERIDLQAADADLLVALAEREVSTASCASRCRRSRSSRASNRARRTSCAICDSVSERGMPVLQLDVADLAFGRLVEDLDRARVGADVHQAVAAVTGDAGAGFCAQPTATSGQRRHATAAREPDRRRSLRCFSSSGKIESILRQSFCAAAHLAVQSGA